MKHIQLTDEERLRRVAAAREKFGRPFAHQLPVKRVTEYALILRDIIRRQREESTTNITHIKRKK